MQIISEFDSGNITVLSHVDDTHVRLAIRPDPTTTTPDGPVTFFQWFCFEAHGVRGKDVTFTMEGMDRSSYPAGWDNYRAVVSDDGLVWRRTDTAYDGQNLVIRAQAEADVLTVAYFAPYPLERVREVVRRSSAHESVTSAPLGLTLDGRNLDRLVVGSTDRDLPVVWILARQHPGESMASWWMEGFLERLLDDDDALSTAIRASVTFHVVPHVNPDGSFRGHLRTNAAGANLNREWLTPTAERSPEVLAIRNAMDVSGVALCLDVHGDEALPYTFIADGHGAPGWSAAQEAGSEAFCSAYERANPSFQREHGYKRSPPGQGNRTMCTNAVSERYGAVGMTLEMPFKDDANHPDPMVGWSPERAIRMGRSAIDALWGWLASLD